MNTEHTATDYPSFKGTTVFGGRFEETSRPQMKPKEIELRCKICGSTNKIKNSLCNICRNKQFRRKK